jgi:hypothetical protein
MTGTENSGGRERKEKEKIGRQKKKTVEKSKDGANILFLCLRLLHSLFKRVFRCCKIVAKVSKHGSMLSPDVNLFLAPDSY